MFENISRVSGFKKITFVLQLIWDDVRNEVTRLKNDNLSVLLGHIFKSKVMICIENGNIWTDNNLTSSGIFAWIGKYLIA